jgi:uncharacterized oxidoreductase
MAPGFESVEIPGEREREHRQATIRNSVALPQKTWRQIQALSESLAAGQA